MTMQPNFLSLPSLFFRQSHRTKPEQCVGLAIFFFFGMAMAMVFSMPGHSSIWAIYHLFISLSMWTLWRRYSLRTLKLELATYFAFAFLQICWSFSFLVLQEILLALVALLLLWCAELLAIFLFWKKERFSGWLLLAPFTWISYIMVLNMAICISNP